MKNFHKINVYFLFLLASLALFVKLKFFRVHLNDFWAIPFNFICSQVNF